MKVLYYLSWFISVLLLLMFALMPMGGIQPFIDAAKFGVYRNLVKTSSPLFTIMNFAFTYIIFGSMFANILSPLAYKLRPEAKYRIGVILGSVALFTLLLGGRLLTAMF